jgi:16S rRNA (guanine527-N7)-methyltransferase
VEQEVALPCLIQKCSTNIGITLSAEQIRLFIEYMRNLQSWNRSINLTTIISDEEIVVKHFVDSFAALNAISINSGSQLLDVGTGAGFPGLPLKIVRPDLSVTLVEPSPKKTSFLRFIIGVLHLENVGIFQGNLERFIDTRSVVASYDYVTTRALKPNLIMNVGANLLRPGGVAIFYSSQPMNGIGLLEGWAVVNLHQFDLPRGFGKRCISVCSPPSDI